MTIPMNRASVVSLQRSVLHRLEYRIEMYWLVVPAVDTYVCALTQVWHVAVRMTVQVHRSMMTIRPGSMSEVR